MARIRAVRGAIRRRRKRAAAATASSRRQSTHLIAPSTRRRSAKKNRRPHQKRQQPSSRLATRNASPLLVPLPRFAPLRSPALLARVPASDLGDGKASSLLRSPPRPGSPRSVFGLFVSMWSARVRWDVLVVVAVDQLDASDLGGFKRHRGCPWPVRCFSRMGILIGS